MSSVTCSSLESSAPMCSCGASAAERQDRPQNQEPQTDDPGRGEAEPRTVTTPPATSAEPLASSGRTPVKDSDTPNPTKSPTMSSSVPRVVP